MVARKLQNLTKALARWFVQRSWLLLCVFIISCLQSVTLAIGDIGPQVISDNLEQIPGIKIPFSFFLDHLNRLGSVRALLTLGNRVIPLFLVQSIPALIYSCCKSLWSKRVASLVIWLVPAIIWSVWYLILSPIYAPLMLLDLVLGNLGKEEIAEGWSFPLAAFGWFYWFWLSITIKNCFFEKSG